MNETQGHSQEGRRTGQCLCGAVRFTAVPSKMETGVCHCNMCRRWTAGPFFAVDCGDSLVFDAQDDLEIFRSSDWGERGFCRKCGTPLLWQLHDKTHVSVSLTAFDEIDDMVFTSEIFIDEKPDIYTFANETKKMTGAQVFALFTDAQDN
ncbi:MAG: GFA family protein [Alphaproteobacteria bacterium]|nr:GFA family protein [Alphaproteobacteria bacterium]